eukprot:m.80470 g.80470  ORF g.80470 m.80470 type:complete len:239 (+) comp14846_c0_seq6:1202-1918(+)
MKKDKREREGTHNAATDDGAGAAAAATQQPAQPAAAQANAREGKKKAKVADPKLLFEQKAARLGQLIGEGVADVGQGLLEWMTASAAFIKKTGLANLQALQDGQKALLEGQKAGQQAMQQGFNDLRRDMQVERNEGSRLHNRDVAGQPAGEIAYLGREEPRDPASLYAKLLPCPSFGAMPGIYDGKHPHVVLPFTWDMFDQLGEETYDYLMWFYGIAVDAGATVAAKRQRLRAYLTVG